MKNIKYIIVSLVFLFTFVSCDKDAVMPYIDKSDIGSVDAAFRSTVLVHNLTEADNGQVKVHIVRGNSKGAVSVPIAMSGTNAAKFTLQTQSVQFADGETEAFIILGYNFTEFSPGVKYTVTLKISDETLVSKSKVSTIRVDAEVPLNYVLMGNGTYTSTIYGESWSQPVQRAVISSTLNFFRLPNCYEPNYHITFRVNNGVMEMDQQNIGWYYSAEYGYVFIQPQTMSISGKTHSVVARFVLPAGNVAFGGTFLETITIP